jgi:beta-N-acetylhexosaminidase
LRRRLGYRGVIVSDDLDMRAIAEHVGIGPASVAAIRAGCDVLLLCNDERHQQEARAALIEAADRDPALVVRLAEAAARVRAMKRVHGERQAAIAAPGRDIIGAPAHLRLAEELRGTPEH